MDISRASWVICITIVAVIILNAGIFLAFSKRKPDSYSSTFGKATREMRNPWQREDERLAELSQRIANLRNNAPLDRDSDSESDNQDAHG